MKLFRSKKQEQVVKEFPVTIATMHKDATLKLRSLNILYNEDRRMPYYASIKYAEGDWQTPGLTDEVELNAENWSELLDKVAAHFAANSGETQS